MFKIVFMLAVLMSVPVEKSQSQLEMLRVL